MKKYVVRIYVGRCPLEVAVCDSLEETELLMKAAGKILEFVSALPFCVEYTVESPEVE